MHLPHVCQHMATGSIDLNCSTRWSEWLSFQRSPTDHTDSMGARLGTCWLCKPDANSLKLYGTSITWRYATARGTRLSVSQVSIGPIPTKILLSPNQV